MQAGNHFVHDLDPVAFHLGPFPVRWYSLGYLVGLLLGIWLLRALARRRRIALTPEQVTDMAIPYVLFGILIGGRLGYVLFYDLADCLRNPLKIFKIWEGGMASHGGMLGVIVALWIYARRRKVPFLHLLDITALGAPFGLGLVRIANFVNGELWGRPTELPWGVVFPTVDQVPRHPSQLYEALGEGLFLLILLLALHRRLLPHTGALSAVFAFGYSAARIVCEHFREPDRQIGFQNFLGITATRGQLLTLPILLTGVVLLVLVLRGKTPGWQPPEEPAKDRPAPSPG